MQSFFRFCVAFVATVTAVISVEAAPAPLFDGKSFAGWEGDTKGTWRIVDGAFEAGSLERKQEHNDFLKGICFSRVASWAGPGRERVWGNRGAEEV